MNKKKGWTDFVLFLQEYLFSYTSKTFEIKFSAIVFENLKLA